MKMSSFKRLCFFPLVLLVLLCSKGVISDKIKILNAVDFADFVTNVSSGNTYSGTTVYLDADLALPGISEPIGKDNVSYFIGTFDGQGHVISDLKINTSSEYAGLFGYSRGLTIRNVVLDSSCSITSTYSGFEGFAYVGGIIGYCYSSSGHHNIENNVNMAGITFNGDVNGGEMFLGGIIGRQDSPSSSSSSYTIYVKNCANYGSVTQTGVSAFSTIGGIIGYLLTTNTSYAYIQNCLNHGTTAYNSTESNILVIGGIAGFVGYVHIENCMNAGKIPTLTNVSYHGFNGSIVGFPRADLYINSSSWTNDVGCNKATWYSYPNVDDETSQAEVNMALASKMNNYPSRNGSWNRWLLNSNNATVTFIINANRGFGISSQIFVLPSPITDIGYTFSGWHTDAFLTLPFTKDEVKIETTLYGMLCESLNYTVTLDVNGGDASSLPSMHPMVISCNNVYRELPTNLTRSGYVFAGWFTETESGKEIRSGDKVTNLNNHSLYARWNKNCVVTFDVDNGNELAEPTMIVTFNSPYGDLPEASRSGYVFMGWFTNKVGGTEVTNETIVSIPSDHTLYARWEEIANQVEVVFSSKNLTKEDVEKIIMGYVSSGTVFTIISTDGGGADDIIVIIEFTNAEQAEEFVRTVNKLRKNDSDFIKRVSFVPYSSGSFSLPYCPSLSILTLLWI